MSISHSHQTLRTECTTLFDMPCINELTLSKYMNMFKKNILNTVAKKYLLLSDSSCKTDLKKEEAGGVAVDLEQSAQYNILLSLLPFCHVHCQHL